MSNKQLPHTCACGMAVVVDGPGKTGFPSGPAECRLAYHYTCAERLGVPRPKDAPAPEVRKTLGETLGMSDDELNKAWERGMKARMEEAKKEWDTALASACGITQENDPKVVLLDTARKVCTGARRKDYGGALENHQTIAGLWNCYLAARVGKPATYEITAEDVAAMMVLVKIARLATTPTHYDSMVDIAGYAAVMNEIRETRGMNETPETCK